MIDEFVEDVKTTLVMGDGSEEDFRENDELSFSASGEVSSVVEDVSSAPVEAVQDPAAFPVEDVPDEADYTLDDVLDAFASGLLSGVSDGPASGEQLAGDSSLELVVASDDVPNQVLDEPVCVGIETYSLSPIESAAGLKGILLDVLGPYDTVVTQYKYQQGSNQYYSYVNDIQPDYPWIASAVLFILLLCSLFHLVGRFFSWMR